MPSISTLFPSGREFGSFMHPYDEGRCGACFVGRDGDGVSHFCNEVQGHEARAFPVHLCRCGMKWDSSASREQSEVQRRAATIPNRPPMIVQIERQQPKRKAPEPKPVPILEVNTKRKMELD